MAAARVNAVIDERAFGELVRGRAVAVEGRGSTGPMTVTLILSDIGFTRMLRLVDQAIEDQDSRA